MNIYLNGIIGRGDDINLNNVIQKTKRINEYTIYLNSEGGDVDEGKKIYDYLVQRQKEGTDINIIVNGYCYSMATVILMSVPKEKRFITENATFMIHLPLVAPDYSNSIQLKEMVKEMEVMNKWFINFYKSKTKLNIQNLKELMESEKILTASEAVELGFFNSEIKTIKAVAYYNKNQNQKIMNGIVEKLNKLLALIVGEQGIKAGELTSTDGYVISMDGEALEVGTVVVITTAEGEVVEKYTGEIPLDDGTIVKIEDNVVIELITTIEADIEAVKKENETLKAQITELETSLTKATEVIERSVAPIGKSIAIRKSQSFVKNVKKVEEVKTATQRILEEKKKLLEKKKI